MGVKKDSGKIKCVLNHMMTLKKLEILYQKMIPSNSLSGASRIGRAPTECRHCREL